MIPFKKLLSILAAIPLYLTHFSAIADQNQITLFLISDPHVDIKKHQETHINPLPGTSEELDSKSFKTLINKIGEQVDSNQETKHIVLLLGDLPAHNAYSRKTTRDNIKLVFEQLNEKIHPSPYYYVFGNNDSLQKNYGPFSYNGKSVSDLLKATTGKGGAFLSTGLQCPFNGETCVNNENQQYGYYSAYLGDHLKLLALNSVAFASRSGFSPSRDGATEELKWLKEELKASKENHERVLLAMHVPPQNWTSTYKDSFKKIIKAYPEIVIGMLAAHTHFEEIHAMQIKSTGYVIPIVYSASLGSGHGNASSFKTLNLSRPDGEAPWQLKDYITYGFIGATAAKSQLKQYYDFNQAFCSGLSSVTVSTCLKKHIKNSKFDNATSTLMSKHYTSGNPNNNEKINPSSKWLTIIK